MRTTIRLDKHLLAEAKQLAARTQRTFTAVVEDALRQLLRQTPARTPRRKVKLPTFRGDGLRPGVDLSNNAAVREALDDSRAMEKLR